MLFPQVICRRVTSRPIFITCGSTCATWRKSMRFYQRMFGAVPIKYRGNPDSVFVERSFLLFNRSNSRPNGAQYGYLAHRLGRRRHAGRVRMVPQTRRTDSDAAEPATCADNYYFYQ